MDSYNLTASIEFNVEFYDVDSMKIVWHGNYVKYFEKARCALLEKIGYDYIKMEESGYAFPVTDMRIKYIRPLKFGDRVRATAILEEYENCLKIRYELSNAETGVVTTKGMSSQMAYDITEDSSCFVCPQIFIDCVESLLMQFDKVESR